MLAVLARRFDADVAAMQRDSSTYCDEPEDTEEFEDWLTGCVCAGPQDGSVWWQAAASHRMLSMHWAPCCFCM